MITEYSNIFTIEELQTIIGLKNSFELTKGRILQGTQTNHDDNNIRQSSIAWVHYSPDTKWVYDRVNPYFLQYSSKIESYQSFQLSEYPVGGHYTWHHDSFNKASIAFNRIVTGVLLLNDDYEGGELEIKEYPWLTYVAPVLKGTLVLFSSKLEHRVTEVTKGTRYSLVMWGGTDDA